MQIVSQALNAVKVRAVKTIKFEELREWVCQLRNGDRKLLRQITLFGHFMAGVSVGEDDFVDWDSILNAESLAERYGIEVEATKKDNFPEIDLPNDWIEFIRPEYNFPIEEIDLSFLLCLFSKELLTENRQLINEGRAKELHPFIMSKWKGTGTLLLRLTGPKATEILFVNAEFGVVASAEAVYLDRTGLPDLGLHNGSYLTLDRDQLAVVFDRFLSGAYFGTAHR